MKKNLHPFKIPNLTDDDEKCGASTDPDNPFWVRHKTKALTKKLWG